MTEVAEQARGKSDARTKKLIEWIREQMCPDLGKAGAKWNDTRVLIFTEYDDTKRYLVQQLEAAIAGSDRDRDRVDNIMQIHSLNPQGMAAHDALYRSAMRGTATLRKVDRELIAMVVSAANDCHY